MLLHSVITQHSVCGSWWNLFGTDSGLYGIWTHHKYHIWI